MKNILFYFKLLNTINKLQNLKTDLTLKLTLSFVTLLS